MFLKLKINSPGTNNGIAIFLIKSEVGPVNWDNWDCFSIKLKIALFNKIDEVIQDQSNLPKAPCLCQIQNHLKQKTILLFE